MSNLLQETLDTLKQNGKTTSDVLWVGNHELKTTWENFKEIADEDYDSGFGGQEICTDLMIVGDGWWMTRGEYDGSEWWEWWDYHCPPKTPKNDFVLTTVVGKRGWSDLLESNGLTEEKLIKQNKQNRLKEIEKI